MRWLYALENKKDMSLHEQIVAQIKTVYDPEIPTDIYELGLIYDIDIKEDGMVFIKMTLTSPMCPVAESFTPRHGVAGPRSTCSDWPWACPDWPAVVGDDRQTQGAARRDGHQADRRPRQCGQAGGQHQGAVAPLRQALTAETACRAGAGVVARACMRRTGAR